MRARPRRRLVRRPPPRRAPSSSRLAWLLLLLIPVAFWAGRSTALPTVVAADPPEQPDPPEAPLFVSTSTAGLCPCPAPRPAKKKIAKVPIAKKKPEAVVTPSFDRPDPTKATAAYLKQASKRLAVCAPTGGAKERVHLEVTVQPEGTVEAVEIKNLDPVAPALARCVEQQVRAMSPPGFDATTPQTFGLTVVL